MHAIAGTRILQKEKGRREGGCDSRGREDSHVWKWSKPHHLRGDDGLAGAADVGFHSPIKSSGVGQAGEAYILQQGAVLP